MSSWLQAHKVVRTPSLFHQSILMHCHLIILRTYSSNHQVQIENTFFIVKLKYSLILIVSWDLTLSDWDFWGAFHISVPLLSRWRFRVIIYNCTSTISNLSVSFPSGIRSSRGFIIQSTFSYNNSMIRLRLLINFVVISAKYSNTFTGLSYISRRWVVRSLIFNLETALFPIRRLSVIIMKVIWGGRW